MEEEEIPAVQVCIVRVAKAPNVRLVQIVGSPALPIVNVVPEFARKVKAEISAYKLSLEKLSLRI